MDREYPVSPRIHGLTGAMDISHTAQGLLDENPNQRVPTRMSDVTKTIMYLTKTTRRMKVDFANHATASFEAMIRLPLLDFTLVQSSEIHGERCLKNIQ